MAMLRDVDHLREALDFHLQRHNLLTANLAHVDTPGYVPVDLQRRRSFEAELRTAMIATEAGHLGGVSARQGLQVVRRPDTAPGLDGNSVSLDRQVTKLAENGMRYEAIGTLVQGQLSALLWAVNDGRGA